MTEEVRLPDGRSLDYAQLGDPHGAPVLFQPGTPSTCRAGAVVAAEAAAAGVRLVSISRPGYGASTTSAPGLASVARDASFLLDHLHLDQVGVFGISGGGPYALATAALAPERVARVVVGAGGAPPREVGEEWEVELRAVDLAAAGDLEGAVQLLEADASDAYGLPWTLSVDELAERMFPAGPPEGSFFDRNRERWPLFVADTHRALRSFDGYVRDNLSWCARWDVDLDAVRAPALLVYASEDQMVPTAHGEWLASRLPRAELQVRAGGHGDATFGAAPEAFAYLTS